MTFFWNVLLQRRLSRNKLLWLPFTCQVIERSTRFYVQIGAWFFMRCVWIIVRVYLTYHSFPSPPNIRHSINSSFYRGIFLLFLVGAFSFKEKCPTITVASFFFFFFSSDHSSSRMYHFLQKLISSLRPSSTNANLLQRVPPFVCYLFYLTYKTGRLQRVPPFSFFSALCDFFFENF